jgi:hypothetical protein
MSILSNRFLAAVRLCIGPQPIKLRLAKAWSEHLDNLDPYDLPANLQADFIELRRVMYGRQPLPAETAPQASIRKMSTAEAAGHAGTIMALYSQLVQSQAEMINAAAKAAIAPAEARKTKANTPLVRRLN